MIAWDELTPEARAKAGALLEKHPQYKEYLKDESATTEEEGRKLAFLTASTWPDIVRRPVGKNRLYHHGTWHYVDFPFVVGTLADGKQPPAPSAEWKPGDEPGNALQALEKCTNDLKDPKASDEQKAIALAWVLHLVGDIQQPLHATTLFSTEFPEGDRGGNSFMVTAGGSVTNLHSLWDGLLGRYESVKVIREQADKIEKEHPRTEVAALLKATTFKSWADESYGEAKEVVYLNGKLAAVSSAQLNADKTIAVPEVPKDYLENARALARTKMALGGYRLADCLNGIFGEGAGK